MRTFAVAPLPNSGARSCAGVYTFAVAPLPNSGARSVCCLSMFALWARAYRPCTDGSRKDDTLHFAPFRASDSSFEGTVVTGLVDLVE